MSLYLIMEKIRSKFSDPGIYLLVISLFGMIYILFAQNDVYKYRISGMFFELFWLPVLLSLIVVPVVSIILWIKKGLPLRSFIFATIITSAINILMMFTLWK